MSFAGAITAALLHMNKMKRLRKKKYIEEENVTWSIN